MPSGRTNRKCQKVSWCYVAVICNHESSQDLCVCIGFAWLCYDHVCPLLVCPGSTMPSYWDPTNPLCSTVQEESRLLVVTEKFCAGPTHRFYIMAKSYAFFSCSILWSPTIQKQWQLKMSGITVSTFFIHTWCSSWQASSMEHANGAIERWVQADATRNTCHIWEKQRLPLFLEPELRSSKNITWLFNKHQTITYPSSAWRITSKESRSWLPGWNSLLKTTHYNLTPATLISLAQNDGLVDCPWPRSLVACGFGGTLCTQRVGWSFFAIISPRQYLGGSFGCMGAGPMVVWHVSHVFTRKPQCIASGRSWHLQGPCQAFFAWEVP